MRARRPGDRRRRLGRAGRRPRPALAGEPPVRRSVRAGAAVVCFSGDKLLGGPQAGLLVGERDAVAACRRHPLARAVRIDKLSLAALEATLALYRDPAHARRAIPVLAMLDADRRSLGARAQRLAGGDRRRGRRGRRPGSAAARSRCSSSHGPAVALDPGPAGADALAARAARGRPAGRGAHRGRPRAARPAHARPTRRPTPRRASCAPRADDAAPGRAPRSPSARRATSTTARPRSSRALTGVDTDRLPEERARGISIALGYAPLRAAVRAAAVRRRRARPRALRAHDGRGGDGRRPLPDGRGRRRRRDAADGRARRGPGGARRRPTASSRSRRPTSPTRRRRRRRRASSCRRRRDRGVLGAHRHGRRRGRAPRSTAWPRALPRPRGGAAARPLLHVDRSFTIRGAGTVVTGTLWSGSVARGDVLALLPRGAAARVRGVQVHDAARRARRRRPARGAEPRRHRPRARSARGDVLAAAGRGRADVRVLDAALDLRDAAHGLRVHVHHGTREAPARLASLGDGLWQLRLERPLLARARRPRRRALGRAAGHARRRHRARSARPPPRPAPGLRRPARAPAAAASPSRSPRPPTAAAAAEPRAAPARSCPPPRWPSRRACAPPATSRRSEAELGDAAAELPALRAAGRAVRVGRAMYAHPDAIAAVRDRVVRHRRGRGLSHARAPARRARTPRASSPRRCSSTSTPRGSPGAAPTTPGS